ncbi:MAG: Ion transport 2 domain protein [Aeromicrobium sp.]|nr:Ion transport 2 domain protein [Aeromicrobium sp.]
MTDWLVTAGGGVVVLAVLIDIFHTLANPGRQGHLSAAVHTATWRLSRHSSWSGPVAMLAVIALWGLGAVLGWALVYWPHMPEGFSFPAGSPAADDPQFLDALYVSLVTISTLGFGDVFPSTGWLRVVNPIEALFGFALLTVAVSWVLQVYPALSRRRALALRLHVLDRAGAAEALPDLEPGAAAALLQCLVSDIVTARVDLSDYAETYYFREQHPGSALPPALPFVVALGTVAAQSPHPEVALAGRALSLAVADLLEVIDSRFLRTAGTPADLMDFYLEDHRHPPA